MRRLVLLFAGCCSLPFFCEAMVSDAKAQFARSSVPLAEVLQRARANANLQLQVRLQLSRAKLKASEVECRATTLPHDWPRLAGRMVNPFACPIGSRTLHLTATTTYLDATGGRLRGSDPELKRKAAGFSESRFVWRWKQT